MKSTRQKKEVMEKTNEKIAPEEKEARALLKATQRALTRLAKETGTVFIGREDETATSKA